ncbi:MAG: thioredoxin family protein, partial [Planctomycetales bacterium]|nr:thioredoxin family protein [Planctomycetales bacterium]
MVKTASTMLPLGTQAPDFSLINVDGRVISRDDFKDAKALLVVFMCNHCPYVIHIAPELSRFAMEYQSRDVAIVGINANDVGKYPQDSPERMVHEAEERGYTFPYLFDETQEVAQAYHAACTPDFFLFDSRQSLVYRGQFDSSRPGSQTPVTGTDLRAALDG